MWGKGGGGGERELCFVFPLMETYAETRNYSSRGRRLVGVTHGESHRRSAGPSNDAVQTRNWVVGVLQEIMISQLLRSKLKEY